MCEVVTMLERELSNDGLIYIYTGKRMASGMLMSSLLFI